MKIFVSSSVPLKKNYGLLGLVLLGGAALVLALLPNQWALHCNLQQRLGLPCPTCGTTRCVQLLLEQNYPAAWHMQPLVFMTLILLALISCYSFFASLFKWPVLRFTLENRKERSITVLCAAGLLFGNWAYLLFNH